MQRIKLKVVAFIEPGADEVIEPQSRSPGERQGIDHELGDGLVSYCVRLVVEDMDLAVPDLEKIDVARQRGLGGEGNGKSQIPLHVRDILGCEVDWHFDGYCHRISREHEALEGVVSALIVRHGLQHKAGNTRREVPFLGDCDTCEIECAGAG